VNARQAIRWCSVVGTMALLAGLAGPALASTDIIPPKLVSSGFDATSVDVSAGAQDLVVTLHITDAESGFANGDIQFTSHDMSNDVNQPNKTMPQAFFDSTQRTSGDAFDGTYTVHVTIPQYTAPGTFCGGVGMADVAGNQGGASFPDCFAVVDANPDVTAPEIVGSGSSVSPSTVDVSTSAQDITFTMEIIDLGSGFSSGKVALTDQAGTQFATAPFSLTVAGHTSSGSDGTYAATLTVPRYLLAGSYCLPITLTDNAGNTLTYGSGQGPAPTTCSYPITDTAPDATPPSLYSIDFLSQSQIQVPRKATDLPVDLTVRDSGVSGFDHGTVRLVQQKAGGAEYDAHISATDRISGTATNGDYRVLVDLPADVPDGFYCSFVSLTDAAGNTYSSPVHTDITPSDVRVLPGTRCVSVQNLQSMVLSPDPVDVTVGGTTPVTAVAQYATGTTTLSVTRSATWYTDDHTVATVSATGAVTGVGTGTTTVHASLNGLSATATVNVTATSATAELVTVDGTSTYGSGASFTGSTDDGTPVQGTITCTSVDGGTTITPSLAAGAHTIDGSSCSGASFADSSHVVNGYQGTLTVTPAELTVTAQHAFRDYGEPNPSFTPRITGLVNGDTATDAYSGSPDLATTAGPTSDPGDYDITASKGSLTSDNYAFAFVPGTLTIDKATQTVTITSHAPTAATFGGSYAVTATGGDSGNPVTFSIDSTSGNGVCTVTGSTVSLTGVGTCVIDADQAGNTDYQAATQAQQSFSVAKATTSLIYLDGQFVLAGNTVTVSATLSSTANSCQAGQPVSFSLDSDPTDPSASGPYSLGSATTGSGGTSSKTVGTTGWTEGVYAVTATFAGTANCAASSDQGTLTVASPGDAANGGGWYTLSGAGRVGLGLTVRQVPHSSPVAYTGHLLLMNNDKWKLRATVTSYGLLNHGTQGTVAGTGDLYSWDPTLNGGLGDWVLAKSGVSYTASFTATTDSGNGKHATGSPGSFGIQIRYNPATNQPPLPNSSPIDLKGGHISLS